jgi:hypothetical protein
VRPGLLRPNPQNDPARNAATLNRSFHEGFARAIGRRRTTSR